MGMESVKGWKNSQWEKQTLASMRLVAWYKVVRKQVVLSSIEHYKGVILHERYSLDVEVSTHFIGSPSVNKTNDIGVNFAEEESSGTRCSERACRDIRWEESKVCTQVCDTVPKNFGDGGGCDTGWSIHQTC